MKKITAVCFSLILILASFTGVFAATEVFEVDSFTGEIIKSSTGYSSNIITLTSSCSYDSSSKDYVYSTSSSENTNVKCNVYDGMVTSGVVYVETGVAAQIVIYRDGKVIDNKSYAKLTEPGTYIIRTVNPDQQLFTFTIVGERSGRLYGYNVPSIFNILSTTRNGKDVPYIGRTVDFTEEGQYCVRYKCSSTGVVCELNVFIDHTVPELEIYGVDNGIARRAVTFGPLEEDSTLVVTRDDGVVVDYTEPIKVAGDYTAVYQDAAGNTSTEYFTVKVFLDGGAWIFVVLAIAVIVLAGGYMIYCKKNTRTR